jgi:hypothetical protein
MLTEYLAHWGLRPFERDFYDVCAATPAATVEKQRRWPEPTPEYTLDEVQRGVPWAKRP